MLTQMVKKNKFMLNFKIFSKKKPQLMWFFLKVIIDYYFL